MNVAVVGLGYVGIPLSISIVNANLRVIGYDTNDSVIDELNKSSCHIASWKDKIQQTISLNKNAKFSSSPEILKEADVAIICVPTPLSNQNVPDHTFVDEALKILSKHFNGGLLILESTVSPGYTRQAAEKYFGDRLQANGGNVSVCFSPEREDPGNEKYTNVEIPKVIGGMTSTCLERGVQLYMRVFQHVAQASSLESAEFCKVHENTFRAINISYVNQVRNLASKLDVDFEEVINLAKTKPFGFMPFISGIGVGGHCIPVDPYFMLKVASENQVEFSMVEAAMEEIRIGASDAASWIADNIPASKIAISGAAYKDAVSDIRCSPAVELIEIMSARCQVYYWDREVPKIEVNGKILYSLTDVQFAEFDGAVIVINNQGRKFVQSRDMRSDIIVDARYKKWLRKRALS